MMGVCHDYIFSKKYKLYFFGEFVTILASLRETKIVIACKNFAKYYFHL